MNPGGPCFEAGPNGYFAFYPQFSSTKIWTALGAFSGYAERCFVFDQEGSKWQARAVEAPFQKSWWRVLFARTVYNPTVSVTLRWNAPQQYAFEELKKAYLRAVDQDDDILTQFVEADELKKKITETRTFDRLVEVYRWMQTNDGDEESEEA